MSSQLVHFLTDIFLGLLYLFLLRVLRAVWSELREPKVAPVAALASGAPAPPTVGASRSRSQHVRVGRLRIIDPPEARGQEFDLLDELTVGRAPGCGVSIPDDTFVSQLHARVFRDDGDLWVEDLGSTNGTLLNDKPVSAPVVMRKGDRLKIGKTVLEMTR